MTTLPEEAVRVAMETYLAGNGETVEADFKNALIAALPFLPVQGAVKKLAWIRPPLSDTLSRCDTDFGTYRTWTHDEANGKWFWSVEGGWNEANGEAPNEEAAKAAAQADYEARILSALEPSAARELALEEILREVDEIERKVWAWSGSAFLNNELEGAEDADCKTELYSELCGIGNTMHWLRAAIRALSSPDHADAGKVEGDGWLPIESAPQDGMPFLVFVPDDQFSSGTGIDVIWYDDEQWIFGANTPFIPANNPTHWRPLPSAPSGGDRHGE